MKEQGRKDARAPLTISLMEICPTVANDLVAAGGGSSSHNARDFITPPPLPPSHLALSVPCGVSEDSVAAIPTLYLLVNCVVVLRSRREGDG